MKKVVFALTILAILAVSAACTKTSSATGATGNTAALSTEAELLAGTFKLEDTDLAVTSDQAKQLLPLWQTLQALSTSNTAATEEVSAVVDQIKSTMTAEQVTRITAMKLTQQDLMSIMGQAGVSPNGASTTATPMALSGLPSDGGTRGGTGAQGGGGAPSGGPGGAPPAGGDFPPGGGDQGFAGGPGGASSTPQAGKPNMGNQVPPPLLNAMIELLQKKIK
jgi:hypothetical protein